MTAEQAQAEVLKAATNAQGQITMSADHLERSINSKMGIVAGDIESGVSDGASAGADAAETSWDQVEADVKAIPIPKAFEDHGKNAGASFRSAFDNALRGYNPRFTVTREVRTVELDNAGGLAGAPSMGRAHIRLNSGGMARYANGGMMPMNGVVPGTANYDKINALLTPGEFIIRKESVEKYGRALFERLNKGMYKPSDLSAPTFSVSAPSYSGNMQGAEKSKVMYNSNYQINVNVKSDSNPEQIARTVTDHIKKVDAQRIRGNRF
jgi:hypothetical protein